MDIISNKESTNMTNIGTSFTNLTTLSAYLKNKKKYKHLAHLTLAQQIHTIGGLSSHVQVHKYAYITRFININT